MLYLDILGASLSLLATLLFVDARVNAWPVSLLAIIINLFLYFKAGIYGDFALHCGYLVTALYGWYCWHASDANRRPLHIHLLSNQQRTFILGFGSIATVILFLIGLLLNAFPYHFDL